MTITTLPGGSTVVRTERGLTIAGTRITLYDVMDYVTVGWPPKLIRDRLELTDRQITDVMAYVEDHRAEVEAEYRTVLRDAEEIRQYWEERNRERFAQIVARPSNPDIVLIREKLANWKMRCPQSC
jgi:uncharacterized protein (DUF433 family)